MACQNGSSNYLNLANPNEKVTGTTPAYSNPGGNFKPDNPPSSFANAPTPWARGRDLYASGGAVGQPFFNES